MANTHPDCELLDIIRSKVPGVIVIVEAAGEEEEPWQKAGAGEPWAGWRDLGAR